MLIYKAINSYTNIKETYIDSRDHLLILYIPIDKRHQYCVSLNISIHLSLISLLLYQFYIYL